MNVYRPECILTSSGLMATGIMEALRLLGYGAVLLIFGSLLYSAMKKRGLDRKLFG